MKSLLSFPPILALVACGATASTPVAATTFPQMQRTHFLETGGKKHVGPYVWAWRAKKLQGSQKTVEITADCPSGYVVVGGGYNSSTSWGAVYYSFPNADFNGWTVTATGGYGGATVTVYASCAPVK